MRERLLVAHFLRRLVANDLISPEADRHEVIGIACAALVTTGLVGTVFLCVKYQFSPLQLPGWTSLAALNDRTFFAGVSMVVMALVAVSAWDALGLDARDALILGPLPLPRGMLVRAKLASIALFSLAFAVALNLIPSVIYPILLSSKLPIRLSALVAMMPAHLVVTAAAGAFGFLSIVALRELVCAATGARLFARMSNTVQAALLVGLVTTLLLLPGLSSDVSHRWLATVVASREMPPVWFVGLHEWMVGDLVDRLPRHFPSVDAPSYDAIVRNENDLTREYRSHREVFVELGSRALSALAVAGLVAFGLLAWNGRRVPEESSATPAGRRLARLALAWPCRLALSRRPSAQAGYFFTLQTLGRSAPHRAALAVAGAACLAIGVLIARAGVSSPPDIGLTTLAAQSMFLVILIAGVRHAVRISADVRAGWIFRLVWSGHERDYLLGVKLATVVAVLAPTVLFLLPVHTATLGWSMALAHGAFGLLLGVVLLEIVFFKSAKVPFALAYEPGGLGLGWSPIYLVAFLSFTYGLAWLERLSLGGLWSDLTTLALLAAVAIVLRVLDRGEPLRVDWDDLPAPATQRLGLNE
jgi:hypothetical protein